MIWFAWRSTLFFESENQSYWHPLFLFLLYGLYEVTDQQTAAGSCICPSFSHTLLPIPTQTTADVFVHRLSPRLFYIVGQLKVPGVFVFIGQLFQVYKNSGMFILLWTCWKWTCIVSTPPWLDSSKVISPENLLNTLPCMCPSMSSFSPFYQSLNDTDTMPHPREWIQRPELNIEKAY